MCPRATARHGGAAMARAAGVGVAQYFGGEEEYIDLDLSSCGGFELRVCRSAAALSCGDELLCRGRLHKAVPRWGGKQQEADAASGGCGGGGRRSTATVAPWQQPHAAAGIRNAQPERLQVEGPPSRRKKAARTVHAKLRASRAFFRSLFARTSCSDEQFHGISVRARIRTDTPGEIKTGDVGGKAAPFGQITNSYNSNSGRATPFGQIKNSYGSSSGRAAPATLRSSIEQEKLMDEEEHAASVRQRKSFSGVIKWRPAPTPAARPPSFSTRRLSASDPPLKRSSSARSESEGLIQGAIAYCKRSQQQLVLARKSVSDAALCSLQFQTQL
ncbi:hypothetical protein GUJ93_ZPchr0006g46035 [Zizania palustris]|uniref:Uncharacterized protein n=1 Tax=Zizania palustris TaxID=103762 RepID=A0A8J5SGX4_ZIZPA|nr:hypothetical protein GUJ93_ZPchr0006g46035 [Zizania palustris]